MAIFTLCHFAHGHVEMTYFFLGKKTSASSEDTSSAAALCAAHPDPGKANTMFSEQIKSMNQQIKCVAEQKQSISEQIQGYV